MTWVSTLIYYFAYGSNMHEPRMLARCPGARLVVKSVLAGFRLVERLYAEVEPHSDQVVEGVLWAVSETDIRRLDYYKGVHAGVYYRRVLKVARGQRCYQALCHEKTRQPRCE